MTRLSAGGWTIEATRVERGARLRVWRMATLPWSDKVTRAIRARLRLIGNQVS